MSRTRNFDEDEIVTVTFGGRDFVIRPQRRALIERILDMAYKEETEGSSIKDFFKNWDRQFPIFALIFGYEEMKSEETKEVLKHLESHMPLKAGPICFEDWWNVNQIQDFFLRGGMPLYPVSLVPRLEKELNETLETTTE
ncbi:MAG TPA: hypothetical protein VFJ52_05945 [Terriglobia bacterium]|nr:hypothetical protein [Terriglobia bacterium]